MLAMIGSCSKEDALLRFRPRCVQLARDLLRSDQSLHADGVAAAERMRLAVVVF